MWTRTYLALLAVRVFFALSPSYIHPDENFQGPEVIAGKSELSVNLSTQYSTPFSTPCLSFNPGLPAVKSGEPCRA